MQKWILCLGMAVSTLSRSDYVDSSVQLVSDASDRSLEKSIFETLDRPIEQGGFGSSEGPSGSYELKRLVNLKDGEGLPIFHITSFSYAWSGQEISSYGLVFFARNDLGNSQVDSKRVPVFCVGENCYDTKTTTERHLDIVDIVGPSVAEELSRNIRFFESSGKFRKVSSFHEWFNWDILVDCPSADHCIVDGKQLELSCSGETDCNR
ncbi:MAG: hypothetical protein AB7T49_21390 [Oligoflexales bacterium]